jgi:hypothetical protein
MGLKGYAAPQRYRDDKNVEEIELVAVVCTRSGRE